MFISICILILVILLIYFYRENKNFLLYITWVFSIIFSYISVYLAYNLLEYIVIISTIYQNSTTSVLKEDHNIINGVKLAESVLSANIGISSSILISLSLIFGMYISSKIINEGWDLSFIKNIFGKRFYYYFIKIYSYENKTNKAWMIFGYIILIIANIVSIYFAYNLIIYIYIITEVYKIKKK